MTGDLHLAVFTIMWISGTGSEAKPVLFNCRGVYEVAPVTIHRDGSRC